MFDTTLSTLGEFLREQLTTVATTYVGSLPTLDAEGIAVRLYSGSPPRTFFGTQKSLFYANVQINLRSYSYPKAAGWCDEVKGALHQFRSSSVLGAQLVGSTLYLGQTIEKLHEFQQVYQIILEE